MSKPLTGAASHRPPGRAAVA